MNRKGMLLIEAIISVVIISISLTLIMQSFLGSYRSVSLQKDYTLALLFLQNQLASISFDPETVHETASKSPLEGLEYRGSLVQVKDRLKKAQLNVQWPRGNKIRKISVDTYVYEAQKQKEP
jgi:type II secretory pathway pseudopilin PulG